MLNNENANNKSNPIDISVGQQLSLLRTKARISQAALALKVQETYTKQRPGMNVVLQISEFDIVRMENGQKRISAEVLFCLSEALNVAIEAFFKDTPERGDFTAIDQIVLKFATPVEVNRLLANFIRIKSPALREQLIEQASALSEQTTG